MSAIDWATMKTAEQINAEKVAAICNQLNIERDRLIAGGVVFGGNTYQTRERDIADLLGAIQIAQFAAASGQVFVTTWLTADNVEVELTLDDLSALGSVVAQHKTHYVYKCREHKNALMEMDTWSDVEAYMDQLTW